MKCEKLNLRNSQGNYKVSFENCTRKERSSRNFWPSSSNKNSTQYLLRTDILQKTVVKYTRDFFKNNFQGFVIRDMLPGEGTPNMKGVGMLVRNFELNP